MRTTACVLALLCAAPACGDDHAARLAADTAGPDDDDALDDTDVSVSEDSLWVAEDSFGVAEDSFGVAEDSLGVAEDSLGVAEDSLGVAEDSLGVAEVAPDWRDGLPPGPFTTRLAVFVPTTITACQPGCVTISNGTTLTLDLAIDASGTVSVTWLGDIIPPVPVAATVTDDGVITASHAWVQPAHDNVVSFTAHLAPGRLFVLDAYAYGSYGTQGMFTGWSTTATAREPVSVAF